jgi:hypothetical protein
MEPIANLMELSGRVGVAVVLTASPTLPFKDESAEMLSIMGKQDPTGSLHLCGCRGYFSAGPKRLHFFVFEKVSTRRRCNVPTPEILWDEAKSQPLLFIYT